MVRAVLMPTMNNAEFNSLDDDAKANLGSQSLARYHRYKDELIADGHTWKGDAELILTGFIWDESEGWEE